MQSEPKPLHFSVITPTYNRIEYLPEAIDSVSISITGGFGKHIDFTFEHLICANGCTDGTNEYLIDLAKKEGTKLRFWTEPTKLLPGPARNVVIKNAHPHTWIVPLDDDDVMLQRNLYYHAALVKNNPDKQWFVNDFLRMDEEKRYEPNKDYWAWQFDEPIEMLTQIFKGTCFMQGNVSYSKKIFDEVGGYHESLRMAEDLDLYVRFLLAGYMPGSSPHISHLHRNHRSNISIGVDKDKHHNDLEILYERYAEKLEQLGIQKPE